MASFVFQNSLFQQKLNICQQRIIFSFSRTALHFRGHWGGIFKMEVFLEQLFSLINSFKIQFLCNTLLLPHLNLIKKPISVYRQSYSLLIIFLSCSALSMQLMMTGRRFCKLKMSGINNQPSRGIVTIQIASCLNCPNSCPFFENSQCELQPTVQRP